MIVLTTVYLSSAILSEAALSFLGLGTQPPEPTWGGMLNIARTYMEISPWMAIFPGSGDRHPGARLQLPGRRLARHSRSAPAGAIDEPGVEQRDRHGNGASRSELRAPGISLRGAHLARDQRGHRPEESGHPAGGGGRATWASPADRCRCQAGRIDLRGSRTARAGIDARHAARAIRLLPPCASTSPAPSASSQPPS